MGNLGWIFDEIFFDDLEKEFNYDFNDDGVIFVLNNFEDEIVVIDINMIGFVIVNFF